MRKQLHTFLIAAVILCTANIAAAQDQDSFCDMRSGELLAALEGQWSFKQGAGYGVAGKALPFPLPAHPAQPVSLEYDAEKGVLFMRHAGQSIALVEVPLKYSKEHVFFLTPEEEDRIMVPSTECGGPDLPSVVGTNAYDLSQGYHQVALSVDMRDFGELTLLACKAPLRDDFKNETPDLHENQIHMFNGRGQYQGSITEDGIMDTQYLDDDELITELRCENASDTVVPGNINLTLVLRFDTQNSASGVLQFRLKHGQVGAAARAPVTLTRM